VDEAYRAAAAAQREWADWRPAERSAVLRRAAAVMEARREEIVDWLVRESGSTRIKADLEWGFTHAMTLEAASFPSRQEGLILPTDVAGKESRVYRQPVGVVGMISPWNFPLHLSNRSIAPALALGNAAVIKPASDTPVTGGLLLAKIYEGSGPPPRRAQRGDRLGAGDRRAVRAPPGAARDLVHGVDGGRPADHGAGHQGPGPQAGGA
jgi:aldehyde dehydrogenase (NAD+)